QTTIFTFSDGSSPRGETTAGRGSKTPCRSFKPSTRSPRTRSSPASERRSKENVNRWIRVRVVWSPSIRELLTWPVTLPGSWVASTEPEAVIARRECDEPFQGRGRTLATCDRGPGARRTLPVTSLVVHAPLWHRQV